MSTPWRLWIVVTILVLLHFLLHVGFGLGEWVPDLLTVALLVGARETHIAMGAGLGFVFGLLEDAFSLLSFGANTVALTVVGLAGARTRDLFVGDSLLFLASYLVAGKWLRDALRWIMAGEGVRGPLVDNLFIHSPIQSVYAAVVGIGVLALTGAWSELAR